jgi:hypothetical protein
MAFTCLLIFDATMTRAKDYLKLYNDKRLTAKREIGVVGKNTSDIHQMHHSAARQPPDVTALIWRRDATRW